MEFEFVSENTDQIVKMFRGLEEKTGKKVLRKAVRNGTKIIHKEAKRNAQRLGITGDTRIRKFSMSDLIANNLVVRAWKRQRDKTSYGVGLSLKPDPRFVYKSGNGERSFIPTAIEYGHVAPDGSRVPAKSWLRKAADTKENDAARKIMDGIMEELTKEWEKR